MTRSYLPRIADDELSERLNRIGAVLIEGAKGCGKTETARQLAASEVRLDVNETIRETAKIAPLKVLAGPTPRLIDEWQLAPQIWNAVRREVDDRGADGLFILTGSASPADDQTRHTGAARFSRLRMRTLSLAESSLSSQDVSLKELLSGAKNVSGQSTLTLDDIIEETCHGGWPGDRQRSLLAARRNVTEYVNEIAFGDIKMADSVRHDPVRVLAVMRALARNTATEAALTTLAADTGENDPMHPDTVGHYIRALERLMVLEPLLAWHPVLRSKARVRTSAKHHFVDPAMTASLLRAGPEELSLDLKTFGLLFESLVLRDLRVYAGPLYASVRHFRDSSGREVDFVVESDSHQWAAFEVKLTGTHEVLEKAAAQLISFADTVDTQSSGKPVALGVIVAEGHAYTRPDGVHVIPLGALGP